MKINKLKIDNYQEYMKQYNISELCAKVLASKQLTKTDINELLFNNTSIDDFNLDFLNDIVDRLVLAKKNNEKIIVCGDYDCDGICATSILVDAIRKFGIECGYYIPNRFKEGYGLHCDTVKLANEKEYSIIFTVDNGVKAFDALALARDLGITTILSDHHTYNEDEIKVDFFLHPQVFPKQFKALCGAGVAYLLSRRLIGNNDRHTMLASVATVGDVVPLLNANRIIVKAGLTLFNTITYPALQLLQNDTSHWNAQKIAFQVVPKINCIGRLADQANPNTMVQFLLSERDSIIQNTLYQINTLNDKRKKMTGDMEELANNKLEDERFIILYDELFHEGLNGILASKLMNKLRKPVMVLSSHGDVLKGSIRSNGVDLTTFFEGISDVLIAYGGHKEAAGISFSLEHLDMIKAYANNRIKEYNVEVSVDCIALDVSSITIEEIESLSFLEPMGCEFKLPLFCLNDTIAKIQPISNGKHLKYISDSGITYLYFNEGSRLKRDSECKQFTFIGNLQVNNYRNNKSINMTVDTITDSFYNI